MCDALGVVPDARSAASSVDALRRSTLDSVEALVEGLQRLGALDERTAVALMDTTDRIRSGTDDGLRVIEPELFEWYFRAVGLLEAGRIGEAATQVRRLPLVTALPLAGAGMLDSAPLTVVGCRDIVLSEREWSVPSLAGTDRIDLWVEGDLLRLAGRGGEVSVPWREVLRSGTFEIPRVSTVLRQSGHTRRREVAKYAADLSRIHRAELRFGLTPPEVFERQPHRIGRYAQGLACIGSFWPELLAEVEVLTQSISVLDGVPFVGGSDIVCFGASFFHLEPDWSVLCYADHIVHEAAHQRFHAAFEVEPALLNPAEVNLDSPIRSDPRPMEGSFHATFVFVRLAQFFERVVEAALSHDALTRLHRHLLGAYTGVEMLDRYARFTERGAAFYEALVAETDRMKRHLPSPDPAFYEDIAVDYERPSSLASALLD